MILPVTTLAIISVAGYSRYVRASMLEVLHMDYIRTARAKGLRAVGRGDAPRPAECLPALCYPDRPGYSVPAGWRGRHRAHLRLAGHGPACLSTTPSAATFRC